MQNQDHHQSLQKATEKLKEGGVILCPTDSLYGLSCDATQPKAIERIRDIKGRDQNKSFIILVSQDRMFNQCTSEVAPVVWDLIDYSKSPLTLVLPASNYLPEILRPNQMTAIRFIKSGYAHDLIQKLNRPLISTSANKSGESSPKSLSEISEDIRQAVDYIVPDKLAGSMSGKASRIIKLKADGEVEILRK